MIRKSLSIQRHLLVSLTGAITALFGLGSLGIYFFMRHALYAQMDGHMERTAEDFIAETHRNHDGSVESGFHELELEDFGPEGSETTAFYELRDASGKSILRSASLGENSSIPFVEVEDGDHRVESLTLPDGTPGRIIYAPFSLVMERDSPDAPGESVEATGLSPDEIRYIENYNPLASENRALLSIAESLSPLRNTLAILAATLAVTGLFLGGATFFLVRRIVQNACRPILELSELTGKMGLDSVAAGLPDAGIPDEMRPLIVKFNELIARLDIAIRREKRFSMDIAHELRTPVAEMRTLLEVASGGSEADDEDPQEIYRTGAAISQRMSGIIEVLTAMHQGDLDEPDTAITPTLLSKIIRASIDNVEAAERSRIHILSPPGDEEPVNTDQNLHRAVLDNLIGNCIAHSPAGSPVEITCELKRIEIRNETVGLDEADLEQLHEPFWQKDPARAASDRFGLGLSLVDVYLKILGAEIGHCLEGNTLATTVVLAREA